MSESAMTVERSKKVRSRVSNGRRRFGDGDGRSSAARRLRDLHELLAKPMRFDDLGEPTRQLVRRAALLSLQAEMMEAQVTRGEPIDAVAHATVTNTLSRLLTRLDRAKASMPRAQEPTLAEAMAAAALPEGAAA